MTTGLAGLSGLTAIPYVGWIIGAAAAYFDATWVMPKMLGKGRGAARGEKMLDAPVGTNEPGGPRIYALGMCVRVPCHVLWQSRKERETGGGNSTKQGMTQPQRRVYFDAMIAVNDRETHELVQMIGNGQLLLFRSRNLVGVTSANMIVSDAAGLLRLQMTDAFDEEFTNHLAVGDVVKLAGFIVTAGVNVNAEYWKVSVVEGHASATMSYVDLAPYFGQVTAGVAATSGTAVSPASVMRVDDVMFVQEATIQDLGPLGSRWTMPSDSHLHPNSIWGTAQSLLIAGATTPYDTINGIAGPNSVNNQFIAEVGNDFIRILDVQGSPAPFGTPMPVDITSGDPVTIKLATDNGVAASLFPPTFIPSEHWFSGSETQGENPLLTAPGSGHSAGEVSNFRGVAYQALQEFYASDYGNQLPFALEALIRPDVALTWPEAMAEVLQRSGVPASAIDTAGVEPLPFLGAYLRGAAPTLTAIQPMLLVGQILGQERDGTICLFHVDTAEIVDLRHTADVSDLGCHAYGESGRDDIVIVEDEADENLPSFVGVRHQDPDNGWAAGFQSFGIRQTDRVEQQNVEIDVTNVSVTRKQARELAQTFFRRAYINRRRYRLQLPVAYADLLENDLVRFTYLGEEIVARIIQRDIGSDFSVGLVCVHEELEADVAGGGVDSGAGFQPAAPATVGAIRTEILDCPAIDDSETTVPGIKIACCGLPGGRWAPPSLWESVNGTDWIDRGPIGVQAAIGDMVADLAAGIQAEAYGVPGVLSSVGGVDVEFTYEGVNGLEDATDAEALAGKNWCAIIDATTGVIEIAAFRTVAFVSGTTWTLSNWFRGLRGTSPVAHLSGSVVVLLWPRYSSGVVHLDYPGAIQPAAVAYKVVPAGMTLEQVAPIGISAQWLNARSLPVRKVTKTIGASPFHARFTVTAHWCKQLLAIGTQPPHPMDEPYEGYVLTIYDPTGTQARRTKTIQADPLTGSPNLRDPWFAYTATEQTADGYTPSGSETFVIDVQQIGAFGLGPSIKQEL